MGREGGSKKGKGTEVKGTKVASFLISKDEKKLCKSYRSTRSGFIIQTRFTPSLVLTPVNIKLQQTVSTIRGSSLDVQLLECFKCCVNVSTSL
jgi:hypothetical protein